MFPFLFLLLLLTPRRILLGLLLLLLFSSCRFNGLRLISIVRRTKTSTCRENGSILLARVKLLQWEKEEDWKMRWKTAEVETKKSQQSHQSYCRVKPPASHQNLNPCFVQHHELMKESLQYLLVFRCLSGLAPLKLML